MRVLVTGGSGYLGSAVSHALIAEGHEVVSLDLGFPQKGLPVVHERCNVTDRDAVAGVFRRRLPDAVVHCAAMLSQEDSFSEIRGYYGVNVGGTSFVIDASVSCGSVRAFVYTSSASVYGEGLNGPVDEGHRARSLSPYGTTKSLSEEIVDQCSAEHGIGCASLRCFNIVGVAGGMSDSVSDPGHLFPAVVRSLAGGGPVTVCGQGLSTPDGTAVRDYVDVNDAAEAHLAALRRAMKGRRLGAINVGSGIGSSILDVLSCFERSSGRDIPRVFGDPRRGDPEYLVADVSKARRVLGWTPARSGLDEIVGRVLESSSLRVAARRGRL